MSVSTATQPTFSYPVHVEAAEEPVVSRWLWLVKWVLVIPHLVVLVFLWMAFAVLSVAAFVAILVTGRYPRSVFEFNAGVLRWAWRVQFYAYGALGTDEYPPFTLADVPDYPAHLEIDYPEHLSRGLVLVKWWLLAIPHYLVVGLLIGSGAWAVRDDQARWVLGQTGLIGLLALVAGIVLAATGRYPRPLYDLLLGLNRWVLRVAGYVGLMTDRYPPFRLDQGPHEPGTTALFSPPPAPTAPQSPTAAEPVPPAAPLVAGPTAPVGTGTPGPRQRRGWTAGRVTSLVVGTLGGMLALGLVAGGGSLLVVDNVAREGGYVTSAERHVTSSGYAVTVDSVAVDTWAYDTDWARNLLGDVRVRVSTADTQPVFVAIGPSVQVDRYLSGVDHTILGSRSPQDRDVAGGAPAGRPDAQGFWVAQGSGSGGVDLVWRPASGNWAVVLMHPDASAGLTADVSVAAELPWLGTAGTVLLVLGVLGLVGAVALVSVSVRRASA
jgi:hypothetical protein